MPLDDIAEIPLNAVTPAPWSGFAQLPQELLFKILKQLDDECLLACKQISFLHAIAVGILLQRHHIHDPCVYCDVDVRIPERLAELSLVDALSALLADRRRYPCVKRLHLTIRPPGMYDIMSASSHNVPYTDPSAEPVEERIAFTFRRIARLLSRVDILEVVHLEVLYWAEFPGCFTRRLEDLVNTIVLDKGCTELHIETGRTPFVDSHRWVFPAIHRSLTSTLSRLFTNLTCGLIDDNAATQDQEGTNCQRRSRLTKLSADSPLFHPLTLSWLSDLFSHSPLTDFTISFQRALVDGAAYFTDHGLPILLRNAPKIRSLRLLCVSEDDFRQIAPHLRRFGALKNLTICINTSLWPLSHIQDPNATSTTLLIPRYLERLSISPGLIDCLILGTPSTTHRLEQLEIAYPVEPCHLPRSTTRMSQDVASVRDYLANIQAPDVLVAVRLPMNARNVLAENLGLDRTDQGSRVACKDPLSGMLALLRVEVGKGGQGFAGVDVLQVDCSPLHLDTQESIDGCVGAISMFPSVKKVVLRGARHPWESWRPQSSYAISEEVARDVVKRVCSSCKELTSMKIGAEEYMRPKV